jgi:hypothetical protein
MEVAATYTICIRRFVQDLGSWDGRERLHDW